MQYRRLEHCYALTRFRCNYIENSWNSLNIRKQRSQLGKVMKKSMNGVDIPNKKWEHIFSNVIRKT